MRVNFDREAVTPSVPVSEVLDYRFDGASIAQTSIAAIWQGESDRLLKQAYRMVRKIDGADFEGIVSDALVAVLEHWQDITTADHCRKLLSTAVRHRCIDAIRACRETVQADGRLADPSSRPTTTPSTDASVVWLMGLCADDTERKILTIYLNPGNQSSEAVADQTQHWVARWTPLEVRQLFARLRKRIGIVAAQWRTTGFTTCGTLPGWHTERLCSAYCLLAMKAWDGPELPVWPRRVSPQPINACDHDAALIESNRLVRRVRRGEITV